MLTALTAVAEPGRLFFTPAQRATLDVARKQNIRTEIGNDGSEQPAVAAAPAAPLQQNVSVNGLIRRSDGKNSIWINGRVVNERATGGINASVSGSDNRVRLSVPESGRKMDIKVGQTVEMVSGAVAENYLRRPAAAPGPKASSASENSTPNVQNVTPPPAKDAVKSEPAVQKRSARAVERDIADDTRPNDGPESK